jgi:uncharacterized membrane protein
MQNETLASAPSAKPSVTLRVSLWVVQALLALTFVGTGVWKLFTPIPKLATIIPWAGQLPAWFLHGTGVVDLCGGIGILLPALTGIKAALTWLAALGCAALMLCAIVFHVSRGEANHTPFNSLLLGLSLFVFWGRRFKAPA